MRAFFIDKKLNLLYNITMSKYYTYLYLDPRKLGKFTYGNRVSFLYEPFYVGKGCNNRHLSHINEAINTNSRSYKLNKIRKILGEDFEPIIIKILDNVSERNAINKEIELIQVIGRYDLSLGPLVNLTDGGDGTSGLIRTEEHTNKIVKKLKGQKRSDEQIKRISDSHIGQIPWNKDGSHTEESKSKISSTLNEFFNTNEGIEARNHLSNINSGENNPNFGRKQSQEEKDKRLQTRKENGYWKKDKDEISESFSNGQSKRFSDPEERRKQSERLKGRKWYNNGISQAQYHPGTQPSDWILGRL